MSVPRHAPSAGDYLSVAIVSGATLAFEILLLRVFSLSQWHHFASLAMSLALLGFGAAGTALVLLGARAVAWGDRLFTAGLTIAGTGMIGVFALNQFVQVRPLFAVWDMSELARLMLLDFVAFIPFFGAALSIGQVFMRWPVSTRRLYAANLFGSGAGSLLSLGLLSLVTLEQSILFLAFVVLASAAVFGLSPSRLADPAESPQPRTRGRRSPTIGALAFAVMAVALGWSVVKGIPHLPISDFQRLSYLMDLPDARMLERSHGVRSMTALVRSDAIRIAPGLSLRWQEVVPSQDVLVLGADRVIPIPRVRNRGTTAPIMSLDYLQASLSAAPYAARPAPSVAVLGTSEERAALQALYQGVRRLVWAEPDPRIVDLAGQLHLMTEDRGDTVTVRQEDPRQFLATTGERFDLVVYEQAAAGGDALSEEYLLTADGVLAGLRALEPEGMIAIPLRLANPPRYFPKLMNVVRAALAKNGVAEASRHVIALRSLREALVLVSPQPLNAEDVTALRDFAENWGFDLVSAPDMVAAEANRFHQLPQPVYYEAARAALTDSPTEHGSYYSFAPTTDTRPYFWYSMRWAAMPDLLRSLGRQGLVLVDWGALILAVTLAVAAALGLLLIVLPLGRLPRGEGLLTRTTVLIYFASLGLGYLVVELAAFQRSILFLEHPVIAAAVVFATFLIGSGIGSLGAPERSERSVPFRIFGAVAGGLLIGVLVVWFAAPALWGVALAWRVVIVVLGLLPLAWAMGRAMPWGLRQLGQTPRLIPWAWGINGFASVIAAPTATLLSVELGQPMAWLAGALCYTFAFLVARRWVRSRYSK